MQDNEIIIPEHRKNKNDARAKRKYNKYKKGGHNRVNELKNKPKGL